MTAQAYTLSRFSLSLESGNDSYRFAGPGYERLVECMETITQSGEVNATLEPA